MVKLALVAAAVASLAAAAVSPALAVDCGDVIVAVEELAADLGPCATDPALTIQGGSLQMRGHTVSCLVGTEVGILMLGEKGKVSEGLVTGCGDGVVVAGTGAHTLEDVVAASNLGDGFEVSGDENKLKACASVDNAAGNGFVVEGSGHLLQDCSAVGNGLDGFAIEGGPGKYLNNVAAGNGDDGFAVDFTGARARRIAVQNLAAGNGGSGFEVVEGERGRFGGSATGNAYDGYVVAGALLTRVSKAVAIGNGASGVVVTGGSATVDAALAIDNASSGVSMNVSGRGNLDGNHAVGGANPLELSVGGAKSRATSNEAIGGSGSGLRLVAPGVSVKLNKNRAHENATDLVDDDPACTSHLWQANVFRTSSPPQPSCIQ